MVFRRKVVRGVVYWSCMGHDKRGQESCATTQIPEEALQTAFLRVYHKLKLHGEMILQQLVRDLRSVREHRMLWNPDVVELNKRICEITDQDRMLAEMNRLGLVDPDIFIAQSNELAWQLCTAKQEKERILGAGGDDAVSKTQDLLETLETMPEFLPDFDGEVFSELVKRITADERDIVQFHLQNGLVWRCVSRIDYGARYCHHSPTLDERPLQEAILAAINAAMSRKDTLVEQIADAMRMELSPSSGAAMSVSEIDQRLTELNQEFQGLFNASKGGDGYLKHAEEFKRISADMAALKEQRARLLEQQNSDSAASQRIANAMEILKTGDAAIQWEESTIRQLVDTVKVLSANRIRIYLHGGIEIEQTIGEEQ